MLGSRPPDKRSFFRNVLVVRGNIRFIVINGSVGAHTHLVLELEKFGGCLVLL